MTKIKKAFKVIGLTITAVVLLIITVVTLFINLSPQFGRKATAEQRAEYIKSGHYKNGKFANSKLTVMDIHYWELIKKMVNGSPNRQPKKDILVEKIDSTEIVNHEANIVRIIPR